MVILSNNFILNRLFSEGTIDKLLHSGTHSIYENCIAQYLEEQVDEQNIDVIQSLYNYLQKHYRNEYFYKNTLFSKKVMGTHSLNTTTALTEVQIAKSRADFIKINGKAVVYEIKTDLDSLDRLESQLADYYKAFTIVNVVTSESNEEKVKELIGDSNVGLIVLTNRNHFSERKKAIEDFSHLDKEVMFKILRKYEFEEVIERYFDFLPVTKPVFYYRECFELFAKIPIEILYGLFINVLKKRNRLDVQRYSETVPYELRFLVYFSNSIQKNYEELSCFLKNRRRC